ncbi:MAG: 50S ribosomal protein L29 [Deltaproteobacteria bacterium]|jgi:large subunit ribosomal protein L29|nr:50S ribosomal protein L29 [Deltaproteobacteria bacterium]MBN2686966.1 50S ribosomal protein L29 [Deltaproteobacteria bacterium]
MKINEIRELGGDELRDKEKSLTEELFNLRFRHATGQLDSTSALKQVRRDVARIKTVLSEKEDGK